MRLGRDFSNIDLLERLYFAYVLSKMEQCLLIRYPIYVSHCIRLKKVQRRFLRFISYKMDGVYPVVGFSHEELLKRHSITNLKDRRGATVANVLRHLLIATMNCQHILGMVPFNVPWRRSRHEVINHIHSQKLSLFIFVLVFVPFK